jgi:hypothetical protein
LAKKIRPKNIIVLTDAVHYGRVKREFNKVFNDLDYNIKFESVETPSNEILKDILWEIGAYLVSHIIKDLENLEIYLSAKMWVKSKIFK